MKANVSSTLMLGMIGGLLAACGGNSGNAGSADSASGAFDGSAKKMVRAVKASAATCNYVTWTAGVNYPVGTVVLYPANGNYYLEVAAGTNGSDATNPTISTYYWQPTTCAAAPAPTPTPTPCNAVTWTAGVDYPVGTVVLYPANGLNYKEVAAGTNGSDATDPTISTYYWQPAACSASPAPTPTPTPTPGGIQSGALYTLVNPNSGRALDVYGAATGDGTQVDIWDVNGTAAQKWQVNQNSDGTYTLVNPNSGKALDVYSASTADGAKIDIWDVNGTAAQKWKFNSNSDGTYTLVNPNSGKALDVYGAATGDGTLVDIWDLNGTVAQKWQLNPATSTPTPTPTPAPTGRIVGGYYPTWVSSPQRLTSVNAAYNLIYLFAATTAAPGGNAGTGAVGFNLPADTNGAATHWAADIQAARTTQHRKIILSVGGAGYGMAFPNRAYSQTFLNSIQSLYNAWGGFDGLDWNTFEGTTNANVSEMIWVSQQLKASHPGFIISAPPAPWNTTDQSLCVSMLAAGALDYCAPQYYDGPSLADPAWIASNVDTWMTLIPPKNFVFGFGIDPNLANYETIAVGESVWKNVSAKYPAIGGAFDWQINEDLLNGSPFATQLAPLVNPSGAPAYVP